MTKKNQFIDIGTVKLKVQPAMFDRGIDIMVTHNGYQWSNIEVTDENELRILWQTIGRYLKEDV